MAKWVRSGVLDNGLNDIKNNVVRMLLISSYAAADSYATVTGRKLAEVVMTSADFTLASSGNNRTLTVAAGKTAIATAGASGTPDLHLAFTDGSANVIWVTDETSGVAAVAVDDRINFPAPVYVAQQPT